jgi:DNA-binding winged helix-turn-helix (wHTH) protein/tetratricopeptide (TPR) repeat protein
VELDSSSDSSSIAQRRSGFRLGDWEVDLRAQRLTRSDEIYPLDPKTIGVLVHLAEAAPNFVSIRSLLARTWPGAVVGDNALYQVISRLRRCFADDPHAPAVLETLSKRGYRLRAPVRWMIDEEADSSPLIIAVFPLEDHSPIRSDPYLADGLTLEIGSHLSKLTALRIISRDAITASLAGGAKPAVVATGLGARYAVSGTVRAEHACVRVTVCLDDVDANLQLWSATFDRNNDRLLALHSEVAIAIAQAVQARMTELEFARIDRPATVSLTAFRLVQRLVHRTERLPAQVLHDNRVAIEVLEEAIALDPTYGHALAEMAWRRCWNANMGVQGELAIGREYAERAIQADPQCAHVHFSMCKVLTAERRIADSIRAVRRAIELNPSHLFAIQDLSWLLNLTGRLDEALQASLQAALLAPNLANTRHHVAVPLATMAQYDRTRKWCERACTELRNDPGRHRCIAVQMTVDLLDGEAAAARARALRILEHSDARGVHEQALVAAETLSAVGEWDRAQRTFETWMERAETASALSPGLRSVRTSYALALWMTGSREQAAALFEQSYASNRRRMDAGQEWVPAAVELASICAVRGDDDESLQWLEHAYRLGYRQSDYLAVDPMFVTLRNDPRFANVLSRMALDVRRMLANAERDGLLARIDAAL